MGTNYASDLADLILYSYEADFTPELLTKTEKKLAVPFNFTFFYVIDILSLNISELEDYLERIYSIKLEKEYYIYR